MLGRHTSTVLAQQNMFCYLENYNSVENALDTQFPRDLGEVPFPPVMLQSTVIEPETCNQITTH